MNDKKILDDIRKYSLMGKLSVFVGAGVSRLSGLPSWNDLVKSMAEEINYAYKTDEKGKAVFPSEDLLKIPQIYYNEKKECAYIDKIKMEFRKDAKPNEIHNLIMSLYPNHILTTNYDTLLEETAIRFGRNFSVLNSNEVVSKAATTHYIIKVHGDFSADFVLKEQDYLNYENDYLLIDNIVKTIFATNLVIFIGYGLNDYNIRLILNWVRNVQADSFVEPIFIHTDKPISDYELIYQESRGLRILDSNQYTGSNDFSEKYASVLNQILSYSQSRYFSDRTEKLEYMYRKVIGIHNLKHIRREDFGIIFKNEYELNERWKIINTKRPYMGRFDKLFHSNREIDFFEDFYANKREYEKICKEKYDEVEFFLKRACVIGINDIESTNTPVIKINSRAFMMDYAEMGKYCSKDYQTVEENYVKAYYLAQLGKFDESYTLYTEILPGAQNKGKWDIYYFSQINRKYLYEIIIQISNQTTVSYGKELRLFENEFLKKLGNEMGKLDLKKLYSELPYEMKERYPFLASFSEENFNADQYYEITKDKHEIEKQMTKKVVNFGLSKFDKLKLAMLDTEKFLYENMILLDRFDENKIYVQNALTVWVQAYVKDLTKQEEGIFQIKNARFFWDFQDILLVVKTFKKDDIVYLETLIRNIEIPFKETEELEQYLCNQIEICERVLDGLEIVLWIFLKEEIYNLLSISPYFVKDNECKLNAIKFICDNADVRFTNDERIKLIKKWVRVSKAKAVSPIIEQWFIDTYNNEMLKLEKERDYDKISEIAYLVRDVFLREGLVSKSISQILKNDHKLKYECLQGLYMILDEETKEIYDANHCIKTVHEMMSRGYNDLLPADFDEKAIIADFFDKKLLKRRENAKKGIIEWSVDEEYRIGKVAAYMFMRDIPYEFTESYNSICDEYDFLLNPKDFKPENFQIEWLFTYNNALVQKLNDTQRKIVINAIKNQGVSCDTRRMDRLFRIYILLTDANEKW